jgi:hypothetical protein
MIHEEGLCVQANPDYGTGQEGQIIGRDAGAQGLADCQA